MKNKSLQKLIGQKVDNMEFTKEAVILTIGGMVLEIYQDQFFDSGELIADNGMSYELRKNGKILDFGNYSKAK